MNKLTRLLLLLAVGAALAGCKAGRDAYAVTTGDTLIRFQTDSTDKIDSEVAISGLDSGETLQQIDFRPSNGRLYGVTSRARVVTLDPATGAATLLSSVPFTSDALADIVMDVNPQGDYLRVIATDTTATASSGTRTYLNARIDPNTGAMISNDSSTLSYVTNDVNFGETPQLAAIAHSNNRGSATSTVEYGLEINTQSLVRITTAGVLTTIGTVGRAFTASGGFDIVRDRGDNDGDAGLPYAALSSAGGSAKFCDLDLGAGAASSCSDIGNSRQVRSIAVVLEPPKRSGFQR